MKVDMTRTLLSTMIGLSLTGTLGVSNARAQAPEQIQAPVSAKAVMLKNRAPVAKDILRVELPKAQTFTLPAGGVDGAGARLFVVEDHKLPLITITVSVRAGSLDEDPAHPGVAAMTAALLAAGTTTRDTDTITNETSKIGANIGATAGMERATVSVSGLSDNTDELIELLADVLQHPTFPADRLVRVKFQDVARRGSTATNAQFLAAQLTRQILYGRDSVYGRPSPSPEQIKAITADDLRAFYTAHYTNGPDTLIGISGDVKAKDIDKKLAAALANWKASPAMPMAAQPTFVPKDKTAVYIVDRPASAQTYINFANIGISRTDPDFFPLQVANYILGGSFNSRLNSDLREEKGYTYGVRSALTAPKYAGDWTMGGAVRNAVTTPAIAAFYDEFTKMQAAPVSPAELEAAKRSIVGNFALTTENATTGLDRVIEVADYGLPADYWDTYPAKIEAVSADDVLRVTKKYLGTGRVQLIAVGERATIEPGVKDYGPVTILTPKDVISGTTSVAK